ncbi:putative ATP synthase F0, subunit A [Crocosphaera subtropica ATCC 51142]|uniref:ATP synthase subunit a 1 n=1 Tax=Crocosphaera subtropica (strain ATCC 51142 / BH68) TaxID=43989 RepID=ATP61_CROS5|nr:F0F1 ATP synthase subunit A [Crocosphaera subtropica]B1WXB4.1 RecName: Full=ATP synthase subunit a 1; AltName: Full=ATP synthase F0 sector subunit a 1; AltName: Full=F-ATPase subunit 6 1 [Crocosphaera subtropica ATCC 51142]ACB50858.1 putative ATP synthase F0, subunit A [Crocosphaera subtropica ATCC 51142]
MDITPDSIIYWQWQWINLNATIVFSWLVMLILVLGSWLITRNLSIEPPLSRWQVALEIIVEQIRQQIRDASQQKADQFLPFIGTLFLFITMANLLTIFPVYQSPAGSLSTTAALALCVFVAVPIYGIKNVGITNYLRHYIQPTPVMLPFNLISEISRTVSLAIRLFGNIMSTSLLVAILISIVPLFFPAVMTLFGLLVGVIQAYVFTILAMVYIASGMNLQQRKTGNHHA